MKTLCAGMQPGGGRIAKCITDNLEKVSPQCKEAMAAATQTGAGAQGGAATPGTAAPKN